ncbi:MAG TPA: OsmC family protein [Acidimicrobiales bacterium]|nr:OsmC family protein [Acidimicrobiales bacterium]
MPVRSADARWEGSLQAGKGSMRLAGGAYEGPYSFSSRFEDGTGTNPEELIAAAHAGCFSMALSGGLGRAGHEPVSVQTTAKVHLEKGEAGFGIPRIELVTEAEVPGISEEEFQQAAETAKQNCPVSKLLAAAEITLEAKLIG